MKKILLILAVLGVLSFFFAPRAEAVTCVITQGCTGTSTPPTYGQLLLGNGSGGYNLVSTSSLGILSAVDVGWTRVAGLISATASTTDNVNIGTGTSTARLTLTASSSLGAELITNGSFTGSATGWNVGDCWTYSDDSMTAYNDEACSKLLTQTISLPQGYYRVTVTATSSTANSMQFGVGFDDVDADNTYYPAPFGTTTFTFDVLTTNDRVNFGVYLSDSGLGDMVSVDNISLKPLTVYRIEKGYEYDGTLAYTFGENGLGDVMELWGNVLFGGLNGEGLYSLRTASVSTTTGTYISADDMAMQGGEANSFVNGGEAHGGDISIYGGYASTTIGTGGSVYIQAGGAQSDHTGNYNNSPLLELNAGNLSDVDVSGGSWTLGNSSMQWNTLGFYMGNYPQIACSSPYFGSLTDINGNNTCSFSSGGWDLNGTSTFGASLSLTMPTVSGNDIFSGAFVLGGGTLDVGLPSGTMYGGRIACEASEYSSSTHQSYGGDCSLTSGLVDDVDGVGGDMTIRGGDGLVAGKTRIYSGSGIDSEVQIGTADYDPNHLVITGDGGDVTVNNGAFKSLASGVSNFFTSKLGIGTTSPWGMLSIVDNTSGMPKFVIAKTDGATPLFFVGATSTPLYGNGARVGVGTSTYHNGTELIDPLTVNGMVNTMDWTEWRCNFLMADAQSSDGKTSLACGANEIVFMTDTGTAIAGTVANGSGNYFTRMRNNSAVANGGGGIFLPARISASVVMNSPWIGLATNTPIMEYKAGINGMATDTAFYIGYTNLDITGTTFEVAPTQGCYLTASSSKANWQAVCSTSASLMTIVDTGVASSTVVNGTSSPMVFRIDGGSSLARFYIKTPTQAMRLVAQITTNVPTDALVAGVHMGWVGATTATNNNREINMSQLTLKWQVNPNLVAY